MRSIHPLETITIVAIVLIAQPGRQTVSVLDLLAAMRGDLEEARVWLRRAELQGQAGWQFRLAEACAQGRTAPPPGSPADGREIK